MTDLSLDTLVIEDFKSFRGRHIFRVEGSGLHFLKGRNEVDKDLGSNGAGKSTLWDAVSWCWYGKTIHNLRNPDVRPWTGKGHTKVKTRLRLDKKEAAVERSISPNAFLFDGKEIGQEEFERKVLPFELFCHTVVLGQGMPLFLDLEPRQKMELLSAALDLDRWDRYAAMASEVASGFQREIDTLSGQLSVLRGHQEMAESSLTNLKRSSERWEKEAESWFEDAEKRLKQCEKELSPAQKKRDEADLALESSSMEVEPLRKDIDKLSNTIRKQEVNHRVKNEVIQESINRATQELKKFATFTSETDCPTCGRPMRGTHILEHKKALQREVKELSDSIQDEPKSLKKQRKALQFLLATMRLLLTKYDKARDQLRYYDPIIAKLNADIAAIQKTRKEKRDEANPYRSEIVGTKKQIAETKRKIADGEADIKWFEARMVRSKFWVKGFKDVRLYVVEEILSELELVTNSILEDVGLSGWEVRFDAERTTKKGTVQRGLNVMIHSPDNKKPVKWESWSGGEGQRLRLVGALALSEVLLSHAGINPNIQVLDEPTQHLSSEGIQDLCDTLRDWSRQTKRSIFYVDHHSVQSSRFDSTVTVVKTSKGSKIE